jgi:hypothetical protein
VPRSPDTRVGNRPPHAPGVTGSARSLATPLLVDEFLPIFDVSDSVATVVDADAATT